MLIAAPVEKQVEKPAPQAQLNKPVVAQSAPKPTAEVQPKPEPPKEAPKQAEPTPPPVQPHSDKHDLMRAAGIPEKDWSATDYIVSHESSWRHTRWNMQGSGAYGLCQALPASKMASAGEDYMTNPVTQLKWCHQYAQNRYGGWSGALAFWQTNQWW